MDKRKLLTIPIEIYQREFDLALYLALVAAKKGFQVLLGYQNDNVFKNTKNGVYFHKDHANWSEPLYRSAIKRGMKTCALDLEGLIYKSPEVYINNRANNWTLENIDIVFAWGENQKKLIRQKSKNESNIVIVGSPKFDVCELERINYNEKNLDVKASKILINTRFPNINEFSPNSTIKTLKGLGVLKTKKQIENYKIGLESDKSIFNEIISFIKLTAEKNNVEITIRPHPGENDMFYYELASKYNNITVDRESDLRVQILSHDCLIHDGCTTAIEARALGKPVFGLRPSNLVNPYATYANKYSMNFTSAVDLHNYLMQNNISDFSMPDSKEIALESIHNWKNIKGSATYKIVNEFDNLDLPLQSLFKYSGIKSFDFKDVVYSLSKKSSAFKKVFSLIWKNRYRAYINYREKQDRIFASLNTDIIKSKIAYYNQLDKNNTAKLEDLSIVRISDKSILLYKKEF